MARDIRQIIERFLETSQDPVLYEPGEDWLPITRENLVLESRAGGLQLQAWNERRNLVRGVTAIEQQGRGKLVLKVARFGKVQGTLELIDRQRAVRENVPLRAGRLGFREQFRRFLRRQFTGYKVAELTTEPDLEHSLSPAYPRALLRQGNSLQPGRAAWAAIGAAPEAGHPEGVLTFGLIWLDYLRAREASLGVRGLTVEGLILYLPAGHEKTTCLRLLFLDPGAAQYRAYVYGEQGLEERIDLGDYGNLDTHLEPYRRRTTATPLAGKPGAETPEVETIDRADGEQSFRVHGLEFARTAGSEVLFGIQTKRRASAGIAAWANQLSRLRSPDATDRRNPLYLRNPEAWLESQVRKHIQEIDASLAPEPVYGQVPAFAADGRGVLDLLAIDHRGRLAVVELKASEDVHLPLQALDYWMRVQWHLERGEFQSNGYFPGHELTRELPRLLLVSPALDFHSSNERVLRYFSRHIPVERIGVGLDWRKELKVIYRSLSGQPKRLPHVNSSLPAR